MSTAGEPRAEHAAHPEGTAHDRHPRPIDERRRETDLGHAVPSMWLGALRRSLVWGFVGGVVGLAVGSIPWADVPLAFRLFAFGASGLLGGAAAGFVYGAGRERDLDDESRRETTFAPLDDADLHDERLDDGVVHDRQPG